MGKHDPLPVTQIRVSTQWGWGQKMLTYIWDQQPKASRPHDSGMCLSEDLDQPPGLTLWGCHPSTLQWHLLCCSHGAATSIAAGPVVAALGPPAAGRQNPMVPHHMPVPQASFFLLACVAKGYSHGPHSPDTCRWDMQEAWCPLYQQEMGLSGPIFLLLTPCRFLSLERVKKYDVRASPLVGQPWSWPPLSANDSTHPTRRTSVRCLLWELHITDTLLFLFTSTPVHSYWIKHVESPPTSRQHVLSSLRQSHRNKWIKIDLSCAFLVSKMSVVWPSMCIIHGYWVSCLQPSQFLELCWLPDLSRPTQLKVNGRGQLLSDSETHLQAEAQSFCSWLQDLSGSSRSPSVTWLCYALLNGVQAHSCGSSWLHLCRVILPFGDTGSGKINSLNKSYWRHGPCTDSAQGNTSILVFNHSFTLAGKIERQSQHP
jgi:hypothetical protein